MSYTTQLTLQDWSGGIPATWTNGGGWGAIATGLAGPGVRIYNNTGVLSYNGATDGNSGTSQVSGYVYLPGNGSQTLTAYLDVQVLSPLTGYDMVINAGSGAGVIVHRNNAGTPTALATLTVGASVSATHWYYFQLARNGSTISAYLQDPATGYWLTSSGWSATTAKVAAWSGTDGSPLAATAGTCAFAAHATTSYCYLSYVSFESGVGNSPLPPCSTALATSAVGYAAPGMLAAGNASGNAIGTGYWTNPDVWAPPGSGYYPCKPFSVTGAANNGSGLIRLTVSGHPYITGDLVYVSSVGGITGVPTTPATVTYVDANTIDLQSTTFGGSYTSGGTVARADSVQISVNAQVVIPDGTTVSPGISPAAAGQYAVKVNQAGSLTTGQSTGATLQARGDVLMAMTATSRTASYYPLVWNPGSIFEFDASHAAVPSTAAYVMGPTQTNAPDTFMWFAGTSAHHVKVRSNAGGANGSIGLRSCTTSLNSSIATYTEFSRLGTASTYAYAGYPGSATVFQWSNCWINGCGEFRPATAALAASSWCSLNSCLWAINPDGSAGTASTGTNALYLFGGNTMTGAGNATVNGCSFDKTVYLYTPVAWTITNNYFGGMWQGSAATTAWTSFSGNFAYVDGSVNNRTYGDVRSNYILCVTDGHLIDPSQAPSSSVVDSNIFETLATGATPHADTVIFQSTPGSPITVKVTRNLLLPNASGYSTGELVSPIGGSSKVTFTVDHNTVVTGSVQSNVETGVGVYGETDTGTAGMYASVRGNISYTMPGTGQGAVFVRHVGRSVSDAVQNTSGSVNLGLNAANNPATGSTTGVVAAYGGAGAAGYVDVATSGTYAAMFTTTTGIGTGDVICDPQFVDTSRKLAKWGQVKHGLDGTAATAMAYLAAHPTLTASELMPWVWAGWTPTNPALSGVTTTFDGATYTTDATGNALGGTPGALAYQVAATGGLSPYFSQSTLSSYSDMGL